MPTLIMTWPLEEFLSADFPRYPGRVRLLVGKNPAFGLNLDLNPSPPVSSFSSCGQHISIYFQSCVFRVVLW